MSALELAPLLLGLSFGFSNGISPGPLCFLTISETMRGGIKNGVQVACSPLIADIPIILISCLFVNNLERVGQNLILAISLTGAGFLFFLAYKSLLFDSIQELPDQSQDANTSQRSKLAPLIKGVTTNLLNPYPYIFWMTVGAPYLMGLIKQGLPVTILFFVHFYLGLAAAKALIIFSAAKGRAILSSRAYVYCMKSIGVFMLIFGIGFLLEAHKVWLTINS